MKALRKVKNSLKKYFFFGLATVVPIYLTIFVLLKIVTIFDDTIRGLVRFFYLPPFINRLLTYPGVGALLSFVFLIFVGIISRHFIGKVIVRIVEKIFTIFPFSRQIYLSIKKMLESFIESDEQRYKGVVMVPFPHKGTYAIGFLTGDGPVLEKDKKFYYVYVPTAINPTSGFLLTFSEDEILESELTVEEAFALILSGGMAAKKDG